MIKEVDGRAIVYLEGDLENNAVKTYAKIVSYLKEKKPSVLCLDFASVYYMGNSAIGMIMSVRTRVHDKNGIFQVQNVNDCNMRALLMAGLKL